MKKLYLFFLIFFVTSFVVLQAQAINCADHGGGRDASQFRRDQICTTGASNDTINTLIRAREKIYENKVSGLKLDQLDGKEAFEQGYISAMDFNCLNWPKEFCTLGAYRSVPRCANYKVLTGSNVKIKIIESSTDREVDIGNITSSGGSYCWNYGCANSTDIISGDGCAPPQINCVPKKNEIIDPNDSTKCTPCGDKLQAQNGECKNFDCPTDGEYRKVEGECIRCEAGFTVNENNECRPQEVLANLTIAECDKTEIEKICGIGVNIYGIKWDNGGLVGCEGGLMAVASEHQNKVLEAEKLRDAPIEGEDRLAALTGSIESRKKLSTGLDVAGIVGGATAGVSGGIGIVKSMSINDRLSVTASDLKKCDDAINSFNRERTNYQSFTDQHYQSIKDYPEYQNDQMSQMAAQDAVSKCNGAFNEKDFLDVQGEIKTAGISSGVATVGGIGTAVTSTVALVGKDSDQADGKMTTEDKQGWRIASTVSAGVSGVAGVVSTVLANNVKKILTSAKSKQDACLSALNNLNL